MEGSQDASWNPKDVTVFTTLANLADHAGGSFASTLADVAVGAGVSVSSTLANLAVSTGVPVGRGAVIPEHAVVAKTNTTSRLVMPRTERLMAPPHVPGT
ncbi:MAG: hypothetical protein ABSG98_05040 [Anaerolineales bacterium]|jgi:hypothetical protein